MNRVPYIPAKTRQELASPAPVGQRHAQIKRIVIPLIANGMNPEAVFARVRGVYDQTLGDDEIARFIQWATKKYFTPCSPRSQSRQAVTVRSSPPKVIDFTANIRRFLSGFAVDEAALRRLSPWRPLEDFHIDALMFIAAMYHGGELVNVVTEYTVDENAKVNPRGYGLTLERDAMMRHIRDNGTPQSKAGGWLRMNPVDGKGIADANITAFRFILLEIDDAPVDLQLSFFAKLPLPINAIYKSGGKSIHALVRVNAMSAESYRAQVDEMFSLLKPFGICQSNKNPSRLTRLVGAQRILGAQRDGQQRLLYLAPDCTDSKPIFEVNQ